MKKATTVIKKRAVIKKQLADEARVVVENVNVPGHQTRLDRKKYEAMRQALMKALPKGPPGKSQKEMFDHVKQYLPEELFPGGAKSGWWAKTVQLDLEAKKVLKRSTGTKPTRWFRA